MADTPEAAPVTPVAGTEETPNTTPQTTEPTTPAAAPQVEAKQPDSYGFTNDQLAELSKFIKGQGGYDKAFNSWKDSISKPAQQPTQQPAEQPREPVQQPVQQNNQPPKGYMSQQEFMAQQYYNSLANMEAYAPIADKIRSGEMFNEMAKFGIRPMDQNGNINDVQVREFFDLYAKTIPAAPAANPEPSNAPTVDYIQVTDGKIDSMDQAARIIAQSSTLSARGLAPHPNLEAAEAYMKDILSGKKK